MKTQSKRLQKQLENIDKTKEYSIEEGLQLLKDIASSKFDETCEAHLSLNIDPKYNDQQLRATLVLPNGTGKSLRLAVISGENDIETAKNSGADIIGSEDLIEEIAQGNLNFDILIATPEQMPKLAKLGKVLGPKGLMPSPKSGTVTKNIKETVNEFKKGKIEYRADKTGIVHIPFGKINFSLENLKENLDSVILSVEKNKPIGVKGKYMKSIFICSTMSPSIKVTFPNFK